MLLSARMNTKKMDARIDRMADKAKNIAGEAGLLVSEVADEAERVAVRAGEKVDKMTTKSEQLVHEAAEKAGHTLDQIAGGVAHVTQAVAHKVAQGATELADRVEPTHRPANGAEAKPAAAAKNGR